MNANTCSECGDVCCRNIPLRTADTDTGEGGGAFWKPAQDLEAGTTNKGALCGAWDRSEVGDGPILWQAERGLFWKAGGKGIWTLLDGEGEAGDL